VVPLFDRRTSLLGSCSLKTKEDIDKLNSDLHREIIERIKLDCYLRIPQYDVSAIRHYAISRLYELKNSDRLVQAIRTTDDIRGNKPSDGEIIMLLLINFILDKHPFLSLTRDFFTIFPRNRLIVAPFSISKLYQETCEYFCIYKNEEIICFRGENNPFSVCLYFLHYVKTDKTEGSHLAEIQKKPESLRMLSLLQAFPIK